MIQVDSARYRVDVWTQYGKSLFGFGAYRQIYPNLIVLYYFLAMTLTPCFPQMRILTSELNTHSKCLHISTRANCSLWICEFKVRFAFAWRVWGRPHSLLSTSLFQKLYPSLFPRQKLIMSETTIFDVLPSFFFHSNPVVRRAALEVSSQSSRCGLLEETIHLFLRTNTSSY